MSDNSHIEGTCRLTDYWKELMKLLKNTSGVQIDGEELASYLGTLEKINAIQRVNEFDSIAANKIEWRAKRGRRNRSLTST